jgi:hypothetical protein
VRAQTLRVGVGRATCDELLVICVPDSIRRRHLNISHLTNRKSAGTSKRSTSNAKAPADTTTPTNCAPPALRSMTAEPRGTTPNTPSGRRSDSVPANHRPNASDDAEQCAAIRPPSRATDYFRTGAPASRRALQPDLVPNLVAQHTEATDIRAERYGTKTCSDQDKQP